MKGLKAEDLVVVDELNFDSALIIEVGDILTALYIAKH